MVSGGWAGGPGRGVLALNSGSSSVKAAVFALDTDGSPPALGARPVLRVLVEGIGGPHAQRRTWDATGEVVADRPVSASDHAAALALVFDAIETIERIDAIHDTNVTRRGSEVCEVDNEAGLDGGAASVDGVPRGDAIRAIRAPVPAIGAVGHRVVHGGPHLLEHARVDDDVLDTLRAAVELAPLHLPANLAGIEAVRERFPQLPQVACLDTAFHRTMPERSAHLPLPAPFWERGIRRYGFHGLSYEYVVAATGAEVLGRAVIAHLGNGASITAVDAGRSVDTSMGLTPTGGVVMGTRPGDLDPGVVILLMRSGGPDRGPLDADAVEELLDHRSGLVGLSGTTSDVRDLLAARAAGDERARLALDVFVHATRKFVGAYAAVLGGLDSLVFTGGIGEHSPVVRAEIAASLGHLGVEIDPGRNDRSELVISPDDAPCRVLVVPTDEEVMIARHTASLAWGSRT